MSFFYFPRRMAAASRFLQYIGLLCLACSCRPQSLHAAAAPFSQAADLAATPDTPAPPPALYDQAAFVLGNVLYVPLDQDRVAALGPARGGRMSWTVHSLHLPDHPSAIVSIASTLAGPWDSKTRREAIGGALQASHLLIGKAAAANNAITEYYVYHVAQEESSSSFCWQGAIPLEAFSLWLDGDKPSLFLPYYKGAALPSGPGFQVYTKEDLIDNKNILPWMRLGQGNLLLTAIPKEEEEDDGQPGFCAWRLKPEGPQIKKERIAILPGRAEAGSTDSEDWTDMDVPRHLMGKMVTAVRTVAGGEECLLTLTRVVDKRKENSRLEGHLYINPTGRPEKPDQIICLLRGTSNVGLVRRFSLVPEGLFLGNSASALFLYPFFPGRKELGLVIDHYWRRNCKQNMPLVLRELMMLFCGTLCPMRIGQRILLNPPEQHLRKLLERVPKSGKRLLLHQ